MRPPAARCLLLVSFAAAILAGCGAGGNSTGSSGPASHPSSGQSRGPAKRATAPRAPAGSRVIACGAGAGAGADRGAGAGRGADASAAAVSGLRASGTDCAEARATMRRWRREPSCRIAAGASRASCSPGGYRCQAIEVGRGIAVSCARPDGSDVAFLAGRRP